jgi:hypothetical protein
MLFAMFFVLLMKTVFDVLKKFLGLWSFFHVV